MPKMPNIEEEERKLWNDMTALVADLDEREMHMLLCVVEDQIRWIHSEGEYSTE